jgi:acetyl-CoA C-acetyltransferase
MLTRGSSSALKRLTHLQGHVLPSTSSSMTKRTFASGTGKREVVILSAVRTPIGSFNGSLAALSATQLGGAAVKEALKRSGVKNEEVDEVLLGNVVGAGGGQAPARQAAIKAGLPWSVPCTTVNKVCSSGMKTIMFAAQSILTGDNRVVVTGGFESMTNVPYYLLKARSGYGLGNGELVDGVIKDGLWDAFDNHHMGMCAEACAEEYKISREAQDAYCLEAYRRAQTAWKSGLFTEEVVPISVPQKKGDAKIIKEDEEPSKLQADKVPSLKSAFKPKGGTVTAANASKLNDGASALIVADGEWARSRGLKPIARILGYADAERLPIEFPTAPALAIPKALKHAGIDAKQVDYWEINEAFSVVALANAKILGLDINKVNVNGGGVSLGHPIGSSGARIVTTLIHILKQKNAKIGVAGICNGGGGASSVVIERL